jgi:hypothetical protein
MLSTQNAPSAGAMVLEREQLERQRDELEKQIAADEGRKILARRKELVAQLAGLVLTDDGEGRRMEGEIAELEKKLAAARLAYQQRDKNRNARSIELQALRAPLLAELHSSAPAAIAVEMEQLDRLIAGARSQRRTVHGEDHNMSNGLQVDAYVKACHSAMNALGELKLKATDDGTLAKEIRKIMKSVPAPQFEMEYVR